MPIFKHFGYDQSFSSSNKKSHLKVTILEAKDLINTDQGKNDFSDPYCVIWLGGKHKNKYRTTTIKDNLNPVWNESFEITLDHNPEQYVLICQLYDKDIFTSDDSLGFTAVSLSCLNLKEKQDFYMWLPLQGVEKGTLRIKLTPLDFSIQDGFVHDNDDQIPQIDLTNFLKEYKNERGKGFKSRGRSLQSILSGNISDKESHRLDKLFGIVYLEDVYNELRTGDIILHSGKGTFSKAIQLGFSSTWSHLSLVVKNPPRDLLKLYNVPEDSSTSTMSQPSYSSIYVVESETDTVDNKEGGGIQFVELRQWLLDYLKRDPTDLCVLRRLTVPGSNNDGSLQDSFSNLTPYLYEAHTKKYETPKSELLKCVIKRNTARNDSNVFCSEFVAECFVRMGLLPNNTVTCNYGPKDFSTETNLVNTVLLKGAQFSPERRIRVRQWDEEHGWKVEDSQDDVIPGAIQVTEDEKMTVKP
ncbi:hypothetical protein FDP41_005945 [Naegleria fowleri]|uniref:C2 domain-containing protein n=1 Tax=Naegleria fowleri TaxID=5763 RepID=A0A6A5BJW3_NAEFO|nr:uncharacterized protein FDP41_005945 [Naegleria fowleri]KAF0975192.1 hypothetical protein FDP41_005945 [Naegleria fowleri]